MLKSSKCSLCPCTSIRCDVNFLSIPIVAELPFILTELLPVTENFLEIIRTSSLSKSSSSKISPIDGLSETSNSAVTLHSSVPCLIKALSGLPPRTKFMDSIITDLPAPVSPESTFIPSVNIISAFSINAKFLTVSLASIKASLTSLLFVLHPGWFLLQ